MGILKDQTISLENVNPTIPPDVNETTVPAVTRNKKNSENKIISENESGKEIRD
jgi:hypothetical protein